MTYKNCKMKKYLILLLITLCVLPSCDPPVWTYEIMQIKNESMDTLKIFLSIRYPDTTFSRKDEIIAYWIYPNQTVEWIKNDGTKTERDFYRGHYFNEHPVWQLFFIKKDNVDKFPDDTIRKYNLVEKRMEITRRMMIKNNWKIIYKSNN